MWGPARCRQAPRVCVEPGCGELTTGRRCPLHTRQFEAQRPGREIYGGDWPAHSRHRRAEEPWCHFAELGLPPGCKGILGVDHPTDLPVCSGHNTQLAAEHRRSSRKG